MGWYQQEKAGAGPVGTAQENTEGSFILNLHIQPGAKRNAIYGLHGDALKLKLAAPPVDGKANAAVLAYVAQLLGVPRATVSLKSGQTSRQKRVRVEQTSSARLDALLKLTD